MTERRNRFRPALLSLSLLAGPVLAGALLAGTSAPAFADYYVTETYRVHPGYGFNGAYQEMTREMAAQPTYSVPTYTYAPTYTYTPDGYVYSGPVTTYTYAAPAYTTPPPVAVYAPALTRDQIKDRLDDQGYDDVKVGGFANGYYNVTAKDDANDRKVSLLVDGSNAAIAQVQYLN